MIDDQGKPYESVYKQNNSLIYHFYQQTKHRQLCLRDTMFKEDEGVKTDSKYIRDRQMGQQPVKLEEQVWNLLRTNHFDYYRGVNKVQFNPYSNLTKDYYMRTIVFADIFCINEFWNLFMGISFTVSGY